MKEDNKSISVPANLSMSFGIISLVVSLILLVDFPIMEHFMNIYMLIYSLFGVLIILGIFLGVFSLHKIHKLDVETRSAVKSILGIVFSMFSCPFLLISNILFEGIFH
jgi:hypothetical protein